MVEVNDLVELKRQGLSIKAISAATGFDRKTIRKYLAKPDAIPVYAPRPPRPSKLEPFHSYLRERLSAGVWTGVVLLRELKARGYAGGYTILTDWLRPQCPRKSRVFRQIMRWCECDRLRQTGRAVEPWLSSRS